MLDDFIWNDLSDAITQEMDGIAFTESNFGYQSCYGLLLVGMSLFCSAIADYEIDSELARIEE